MTTIKPTHKSIQNYYDALAAYSGQQIKHETAVRSAFQNLLAETGKTQGWTLIPELSIKVGGKQIRPDGTFRDEFHLPRGYWEAKDDDDKLDAEIRRKTERGYPLINTIFQNNQQAVLFQDGKEKFRADLAEKQHIADLLNQFFAYAEPDIEGFEQAVTEFKERVPQLAQGLDEKIKAAHTSNKKFKAAYTAFYELCQTALNPNISEAAVDEMLVQHLLTERLFRKIFDNPEFTRRNVIAAEVEKVIDALVSQSFNRDEFLKSLDRFYRAIEDAARYLEDFSEKQHFLNSVYERFFQGYSVKTADTHGIVYTPQPIVDFMCASVEEVLKNEFGLGLGDEGVNILDPCTGTGNFMVNLLRRIPKRDLQRVYSQQLFANEVMLLPYYIASLNIEHAYYDLTQTYEPFEGLCFVDTLELAEGQQMRMAFMTAANTARVERQKNANITVIIGNPPYNVGQLNENDNNKNRKYEVIDQRIRDTYARDSKATLNTKLYDSYVKFFRWAVDRLQGQDGIVCYVSNNSFVDQIAFDGMRKHLLQDFTRIYHLDLHGNVRQNPKLSGTTHNVFGIQVGVGITIAVCSSKHSERKLLYHRVPELWRKEEKLSWLTSVVENITPPLPLPLQGEGQGWGSEGANEVDIEDEQNENSGWVGKYQINRGLWQKLKPIARQHRKEQTPAEKRLWEYIRKEKIRGFKFRRQHIFERFIVDFYCAEAKLVIEVDGSVHDYTFEDDAIRQEFLESLGLRVIRFTNDDVMKNLEGVLAMIQDTLQTNPTSLPRETNPNPTPLAGQHPTPPPPLARGGNQREGSSENSFMPSISWQNLSPDNRNTWLISEHSGEFESFLSIGGKETKAAKGHEVEAIFKMYSLGVSTNRDDVVYDFNKSSLIKRMDTFCDNYNAEVDRFRRKGKTQNIDDFLDYSKVKWSRNLKRHLMNGDEITFDKDKVRKTIYRPYVKTYLYFADATVDELGQFPNIFPTPKTEEENRVIMLTSIGSEKPFMALITNVIPDLHATSPGTGAQCFPFYTYESDSPPLARGGVGVGSNRRENITDWALKQYQDQYGDERITKWDIFYYVYGVLHQPGYRAKFADNLKRELPRIPFMHPTPSLPLQGEGVREGFWEFSAAGKQLADLHLNYEIMPPYKLEWIEAKDKPLSFAVEKMRLNKEKTELVVNPSLTLAGIPAEAFAYRLGNRSALEWVIDQYQVKKDDRSGITSDPNREDDERYIVDLVGRVITVSVETVKIVNALPEFVTE